MIFKHCHGGNSDLVNIPSVPPCPTPCRAISLLQRGKMHVPNKCITNEINGLGGRINCPAARMRHQELILSGSARVTVNRIGFLPNWRESKWSTVIFHDVLEELTSFALILVEYLQYNRIYSFLPVLVFLFFPFFSPHIFLLFLFPSHFLSFFFHPSFLSFFSCVHPSISPWAIHSSILYPSVHPSSIHPSIHFLTPLINLSLKH